MTTVLDRIALVLALLTFPWAVYFIAIYAGDGWWRQWFGRSLMAIAVGVLVSCAGAILVRLYGFDWWGRSALGVVVWTLVLFGMVARTLVLRSAQRRDRAYVGPRRRTRRGDDWRH
jgi:bacteriorhodopsin